MMVLGIVGSFLVLIGLDGVLMWRRARRRRAMAPTKPARGDTPKPMSYADAETALATRLVDGRLDPARYRDAMAAIAAIEERVSGLDPVLLIALDDAAGPRLRRLAADLPDLPRATLYAAVALARNGATVENLTRLLGLTHTQAVQVVATAGKA